MRNVNEDCAVIVQKTQAALAAYLQQPETSKADTLAKLFEIYDGAEHRATVVAVSKRANAQQDCMVS